LKNKILHIVFLFSLIGNLFAVDVQKADSLKAILSNDISDSLQIKVLNDLFILYIRDEPNTAMGFASNALNLAQQSENIYGIALSHHHLGYYHYVKGNYDEAHGHWSDCLKLRKKLGDKKAISQSLGNLGIINKIKGNIIVAISFYLEALKIDEELGNKSGVARHLSNIASIYWNQGNVNSALEYTKKSLEIYMEIDDEKGIAYCKALLGLLYNSSQNFEEATRFHKEAVEIYEKIGDKLETARVYGNLGVTSEKIKDYQTALSYYQTAYKINLEIDNKRGMSDALGNIGSVYTIIKKYSLAEKYLIQAVKISDEVEDLKLRRDQNKFLYELYDILNQSDKALFYYKKFVAAKDSLINEKNTEEIVKKQMEYNYNTIKIQDSLEFAKKQAIKDIEIKQQQTQLEKERNQKYFIFFVGLLVLIFALVFYQKFKQTRYQKLIIEKQKLEVTIQKNLIEERNKEVTDSISYANLIQQAMLKSDEECSQLFKDFFTYYKPKDIVSGDFYWLFQTDKKIYVAVADCTGHGVPGAFMSMLGMAFLNDILNDFGAISPAEILNKLRGRIIKELNQDGEAESSKDGMDISLVSIDLSFLKDPNVKYTTMEWAGANNPLWLVRKNLEDDTELIEIKPNKQPISYYSEMTPFEQHEIEIQKGDKLFLFSDGFSDQFGGNNEEEQITKGKKYKAQQFKNFLISNHHTPLEQMKEKLDDEFYRWKGSLPQIDDICILGIEV
jgi:serine phosphatase RsbU (regulator of sigma subunit)